MGRPKEIWKTIPGFPRYQISNMGRIIGVKGRLMSPATCKGYKRVGLMKNGISHGRTVHSLVALAFIGKRPKGQIVRHKDGVRANNKDYNLCYGTYADNEADKIRHGTVLYGEKNPMSKLTTKQVNEIKSRYVPGSKVNGARAMAREFCMHYKNIERTINGIQRKYG